MRYVRARGDAHLSGGYRKGYMEDFFARSIAHAIVCHEFAKPHRKASRAADIVEARAAARDNKIKVSEAAVERFVAIIRAERLRADEESE